MSLCKISRYVHTCVCTPEPPASCAEPSGQPMAQARAALCRWWEEGAQHSEIPALCQAARWLGFTLENAVHRDSLASASKSCSFESSESFMHKSFCWVFWFLFFFLYTVQEVLIPWAAFRRENLKGISVVCSPRYSSYTNCILCSQLLERA